MTSIFAPVSGTPILAATHQGASVADEFRHMLERLAAAGKRIVVVMPHPSDKDQFNAALRRAVVAGSTSDLTTPGQTNGPDAITAMIESLPSHIKIDRIYPDRMMCAAGACRLFDKAGNLYLSDGAHLAPKMADDIVATFQQGWQHGHQTSTAAP